LPYNAHCITHNADNADNDDDDDDDEKDTKCIRYIFPGPRE